MMTGGSENLIFMMTLFVDSAVRIDQKLRHHEKPLFRPLPVIIVVILTLFRPPSSWTIVIISLYFFCVKNTREPQGTSWNQNNAQQILHFKNAFENDHTQKPSVFRILSILYACLINPICRNVCKKTS